MLDRMSDASRIVDKAGCKKTCRAQSMPSDRRAAVNLLISKTGMDLLKKLDGWMMLPQIYSAPLPVKKIELLNTLLDDLRGPKK